MKVLNIIITIINLAVLSGFMIAWVNDDYIQLCWFTIAFICTIQLYRVNPLPNNNGHNKREQ